MNIATKSLEQTFTLLEALPDPIILLTRSRMVIRSNSAARALLPTLASSGSDPIGISRLIRDPDFLEAVDKMVAGDGQADVKLTLPGPIERFLSVKMVSLSDVTGDADEQADASSSAAVLIRFSDETILRRTEQMRADFIANASHELRTPLAALIGYIETLQGPAREDADARDQFLNIMSDQARRMHRLINDLLSLSRIELDEHQAPRDPIRVRDLITSTLNAVTPLAEEEQVTVNTSCNGEALDQTIAGDVDELVQVLQNLVENAIRYGGDKGHVDICSSMNSDGRSIGICICDHGPGIAAEHIPRLTERFYRVDKKESRNRGGTGLGLAIVKHILNRHRGRLQIDSTPGEGSKFTAILPLFQPETRPDIDRLVT